MGLASSKNVTPETANAAKANAAKAKAETAKAETAKAETANAAKANSANANSVKAASAKANSVNANGTAASAAKASPSPQIMRSGKAGNVGQQRNVATITHKHATPLAIMGSPMTSGNLLAPNSTFRFASPLQLQAPSSDSEAYQALTTSYGRPPSTEQTVARVEVGRKKYACMCMDTAQKQYGGLKAKKRRTKTSRKTAPRSKKTRASALARA
jgi:hypothetical protein